MARNEHSKYFWRSLTTNKSFTWWLEDASYLPRKGEKVKTVRDLSVGDWYAVVLIEAKEVQYVPAVGQPSHIT